MLNTDNKIEAVIEYRDRGWNPKPGHFPIFDGSGQFKRCSCGDAQCGNPGNHEHHGVDPSELDSIHHLWDAFPELNIIIPTGKTNGIVVIDCDVDEDGEIADIDEEILGNPMVVETPSGGRHLYYQAPDEPLDMLENYITSGVTILSEGYFATAPPSIHESGDTYRWADDSPDELNPLPNWLIDICSTQRNNERIGLTQPHSQILSGMFWHPQWIAAICDFLDKLDDGIEFQYALPTPENVAKTCMSCSGGSDKPPLQCFFIADNARRLARQACLEVRKEFMRSKAWGVNMGDIPKGALQVYYRDMLNQAIRVAEIDQLYAMYDAKCAHRKEA